MHQASLQEACKQELREMSGKLLACQAERDGHALRLEQVAPNDSAENAEARLANKGILNRQLQRISELESEVSRLRKVPCWSMHSLVNIPHIEDVGL